MSIHKTHAISAVSSAETKRMTPGPARHLKTGASEPSAPATNFTLSQAMTALHTQSGQDIRTEKVSAIRESMNNGTYRADSSKIAAGLLKALNTSGPDEY